MPRLIWTPEASTALQRVYHFLAQHDKSLARLALARIRSESARLALNPMMVRPASGAGGARRELIIQFGHSGYVVQYEIDRNDILILGLRHQRAQRP